MDLYQFGKPLHTIFSQTVWDGKMIVFGVYFMLTIVYVWYDIYFPINYFCIWFLNFVNILSFLCLILYRMSQELYTDYSDKYSDI